MIYLNDRIVAREKALISVFDHGFLYGDGIYETMRVYDGNVFLIEEHIARLFRSAELICLDIARTKDEIMEAVSKTIRANRLTEAVVRVTVSRGEGPTGLDPALCPNPTFVIMAQPFRSYPRDYYSKGIRIIVTRVRRNCRKALDPRIKSLNFLNNILSKIETKKAGAAEGIMLNQSGYLTEGTVSNIFFTDGETIFTPSVSSGLLDGITRGLILDIAKAEGIPVTERRFRKEDLYNAGEIFLSNTTMEAMPVAGVDGLKVRNSPGEITKLIRRRYKERVRKMKIDY